MRRVVRLLLCVMMLICMSGCHGDSVDHHTLTVHMMDVGDADCCLLTQGDNSMLIDAGLPESKERIVAFLTENRIERLDYLVMTHPHGDHIGAMEAVLSAVEVGELWYIDPPSELVESTLLHRRFAAAVRDKNVATRDVSTLTVMPLGGAVVTVYPLTNEYEDLNDYSVVCMVSFAGKRLLMTGDATTHRLEDLANAGYDLKADIVKIPHHGAAGSVCDLFFDKVSPSYALISCGRDNEKEHPSEKVINVLTSRDVTIYRTDLHGTVTARISVEGIFWKTAR